MKQEIIEWGVTTFGLTLNGTTLEEESIYIQPLSSVWCSQSLAEPRDAAARSFFSSLFHLYETKLVCNSLYVTTFTTNLDHKLGIISKVKVGTQIQLPVLRRTDCYHSAYLLHRKCHSPDSTCHTSHTGRHSHIPSLGRRTRSSGLYRKALPRAKQTLWLLTIDYKSIFMYLANHFPPQSSLQY